MEDDTLQRYSRQLLLEDIDIDGQEALMNSHVLIVGVGGLGATVAQILVAAGVGRVTLWDHDQVELSNLQRQPLYNTDQVGMNKVEAAKERLAQINPLPEVDVRSERLTIDAAQGDMQLVDIALDCTDNYQSRCDLNTLAIKYSKPLIAAAAIRFEGQLMTFKNQGGPCYTCLTSQMPINDVPCREVGVLASQVIMMASMQAQAALKYLLGFDTLKDGYLLMVDGKRDTFETFNIMKRPDCPACSNTPGEPS
jgi:adenylyltransferase/sulfurtransferase